MAYYSVTGNPVSNTRGQSPLIRAEFTLIQTGFASAETAVGLRGVIAGQTWSGTHDFSSCTAARAPTISGSSENSTKIATTAFVQQVLAGAAGATYSNATPLANGVADSGVGAGAARYDHVHPLSSSTLNSIVAATGTATIANGDNPITWNWAQTTAAQTAFKFGETSAATGGSGSQYLLEVETLASSTARPFSVTTRGIKSILVDYRGDISLLGATSAVSGSAGRPITITGGSATSNNDGGAIVLTGGAGGTSGGAAGGAVSLTSGAGNSGASGAATLASGIGTSSSSGVVTVKSGNTATSGATGNVNITVGSPAAGTSLAGILTLTGGSSRDVQSGNSGGVVINGGAAGAVASIVGGPVVITAGAGSTTTTGGAGGAVTITAGAAGLAATGGAVAIRGGSSGNSANGIGGNVTIRPGDGVSGTAGSVSITGGDSAGGYVSPAVSITGGRDGTNQSGNSGGVVITGGAPTSGAIVGGPVVLAGGQGGPTGVGGAVRITSGAGGSTSGNSGDITITIGSKTSGSFGKLNLVNVAVANGSVATAMSSVGPTGAATTIQGWFLIQNGGVDRYVPFW